MATPVVTPVVMPASPRGVGATSLFPESPGSHTEVRVVVVAAAVGFESGECAACDERGQGRPSHTAQPWVTEDDAAAAPMYTLVSETRAPRLSVNSAQDPLPRTPSVLPSPGTKVLPLASSSFQVAKTDCCARRCRCHPPCHPCQEMLTSQASAAAAHVQATASRRTQAILHHKVR